MTAIKASINSQTILAEAMATESEFNKTMVLAELTAAQESAWNAAFGATTRTITVSPSSWVNVLGTVLGIATTEDIYITVAAFFGQERKLDELIILRRQTEVARVETITVVSAADGQYSVEIDGDTFSFAASSSTVTAIRDGLVSAINGGSTNVTTATVSTDAFTLTANNAGLDFTVEVSGPTTGAITSVTSTASHGRKEDVLDVLDTVDFYFVLDSDSDDDQGLQLGQALNPVKRFYLHETNDANVYNSTNTDNVAVRANTLNLAYMAVFFSGTSTNRLAAAEAGKVLTRDPGVSTWAFQSLQGVVADSLTESDINVLKARNVTAYVDYPSIGGRGSVGGGTTSGSFIDLIRLIDAIDNRIEVREFNFFLSADKVGFNDVGMEGIKSVAFAAILEFAAASPEDPPRGIEANSIEISVAPASEAPPSQRARRKSNDVIWSARATGAIHEADIRGEVRV